MRSISLSTIQRACVLIAMILLSTSSAYAQDQSSLTALQAKWKELDSKLNEKEAALSGDGDIDKAKSEYQDLIDESKKLIAQIEEAAFAELDKNANDSNAIRAILGIMLNDAEAGKDNKVLRSGDRLIGHHINSEYFKIAAKSERLSTPAREIFDELIIRQKETIDNDLPRVKIETTNGTFVVELFENEAPNTVGNFVSLVEKSFYKDIIFHRVAEGFMAQTGGFKLGDDGKQHVEVDGPGYEIKCECEEPDTRLHFTGSLSMAHRGKDTGGSQFFVTFKRTSHLDRRHTCFGRIVEGHDIVDKLVRNHVSDPRAPGGTRPIPGVKPDKIIGMELLRKRNHEYVPDKVANDAGEQDEPTKSGEAAKSPEESEPEKIELEEPKTNDKEGEKEDK